MMNVFERSKEIESWLTPPSLINSLGEFDLDPCAAPEPKLWSTAKHMITLPEDGLEVIWKPEERVWLNPPYGKKTIFWMKKMAKHHNGIALIFARTETHTWRDYIWPIADSVFFLSPRVKFLTPQGTLGIKASVAPSALISYTEYDTEMIRKSGNFGFLCINIQEYGKRK